MGQLVTEALGVLIRMDLILYIAGTDQRRDDLPIESRVWRDGGRQGLALAQSGGKPAIKVVGGGSGLTLYPITGPVSGYKVNLLEAHS